jgi:enoyl-CoA hydratase
VTSPESLVVASRTDSVTVLTLARPSKANAMDADLSVALLQTIRRATADGAGALVIAGEGDSFSAGGDVRTIQQMQDPKVRAEVLEVHRELFWEMLRLPIPTVSAINGPAVGAGLTLALLSDLVVMSEEAFLSDPRVSLGLLDGAGGLVIWPLLTSLSAAREHLMLGDRVTAAEAYRIGLVNRVVPKALVMAEATDLARRLASQPRQAVRETRRLLNAPLEAAASLVLDQCTAAESECFDSAEHRAKLEELVRRVESRDAASQRR